MNIEDFLEQFLPRYKENKNAAQLMQKQVDADDEMRVGMIYNLDTFAEREFPSFNKIKSAVNTYIMSIDHQPQDRPALRRILLKKCKLVNNY